MGSVSKLVGHLRSCIRPAIQTAILMSTGDIIAQTFIDKRPFNELNWVRTRQFACVGFFLIGPTTNTWYRTLAKRITTTDVLGTFKKVGLDQLVFAPCFVAVILYTLGIVQGNKSEIIVSNIKKNYKDVMLTNYKLFPAVQLINFYLVPLKHQVLLVQFVALVFNTYLSWKTQSEGVKN